MTWKGSEKLINVVVPKLISENIIILKSKTFPFIEVFLDLEKLRR